MAVDVGEKPIDVIDVLADVENNSVGVLLDMIEDSENGREFSTRVVDDNFESNIESDERDLLCQSEPKPAIAETPPTESRCEINDECHSVAKEKLNETGVDSSEHADLNSENHEDDNSIESIISEISR